MNLRTLLTLLGVFLVVAVGYFFVYLLLRTDRLDVRRPMPPPIVAHSFETPASELLVPFEVSLHQVSQATETTVPRTISDQKGLPNFGPTAGNRVGWHLTRNKILVSASNGRLHLETKIAGTATVRGKIQPIRGSVGKLLGKLKPSVPYSQTVRLAATVRASTAPELNEDWRIQPKIQGKVSLRKARARIAKVINLSLRDTLQDDVDRAVNKEVAQLNKRVAGDDFLEKAARDAWIQLCRPISLYDVGQAPLYLVIKPLNFLAKQPEVEGMSVRLGLGLRAKMALISKSPEDVGCGEFPQKLTVVKEVAGESVVALEAALSYSFLNAVLAEQVRRGGVVEADGARAEIKAVTLEPFGTRLLATVEGSFRETKFLGARVQGKIFFEVEPTLDAKRQAINIAQAKIGASSQQALGKVAAGVLSILAGAIEKQLQHFTLDLKPLAEKERERASKALMRLTKKQDTLQFSKAKILEIRLERLQVDNSGLRVLVLIRGRLAVVATKLPVS